MKRKMSAEQMMQLLNKENIHTWFDLGLYIDRLKENRHVPVAEFNLTYEFFKNKLSNSAMAFITFYGSVDGVTIEIEKYSKLIRSILPKIPMHFITGKFFPQSDKLIYDKTIKHEIPEMKAFNEWELYDDFFYTKLERGSAKYNELILKFWEDTKNIANKLAHYIEANDIRLLYLINTNSNPGNVSLALANVLVSEYLGIPVINNNHDFYWEGGSPAIDIELKKAKKGPRDFFFTNSHLGEFFTIIEMIYPWDARHWIQVNINKEQNEHLILKNGINPANVSLIGTAVDTKIYQNISKRQKINAFYQFEQILARYKETLIKWSVQDVIDMNLVDPNNPRPILIGWEKTKAAKDFLAENIIFLQPTRIVSRKRIETGFKLIKQMFDFKNFIEKFRETEHLKLTVLITGPIPAGQYEYFLKLLDRFNQLLKSLPEDLRDKVNLALLFSELDSEKFESRFKNNVGIPELYNIASLVLLPSKTEGRGLPIIEAAACGTPIFCRRYQPEAVYSDVIGENLPEIDRLKVIEFDGKQINKSHVQTIFNRVFFPHNYTNDLQHNLAVVQKRYSLTALEENLKSIIYQLFRQLRDNSRSLRKVKASFQQYADQIDYGNANLKAILNTENREYLAGYNRLFFMAYLKSLIDPSYFRVEEMETKGMAFNFARELLEFDKNQDFVPFEKKLKFLNAVENLFLVRDGELILRHDHSLPYRHRNKNNYLYQKYTIQELTGLIRLMYLQILQQQPENKKKHTAHFFTDWNLALSQLTSSTFLAIDDRELLFEKMKSCVPLALFPGHFFQNELEFFVLQAVRKRFNLPLESELDENFMNNWMAENDLKGCPIYIFAPRTSLGKNISSRGIIEFLESGMNSELTILYQYHLIQVIRTQQLCEGIHFPQLGEEPLQVLRQIKERGGYIISNDPNAAFTTDIVDIDRFHIGKTRNEIEASIMGIPMHSGYIQFVPAGVRTTLAYPTPIQTAKDFNTVMKSDQFKALEQQMGTDSIWEKVKLDAEKNGSPLQLVLDNLTTNNTNDKDVDYKFISGVYDDGFPYNGILAKANVSKAGSQWEFLAVSSETGTKRVTEFVNEWQNQTGKHAKIAWNGGYILNPELVGKLGQPESYIGSPLGLLVSDTKVLCPPLFNKAALLIYTDGTIDIERVNCSKGITVEYKNVSIQFNENTYNTFDDDNVCYYDLMYDSEQINAKNRVIIRLAGNQIKEIIRGEEKVNIIPVGLTLSFPENKFPAQWNEIDASLNITVNGLDDLKHAVEAGPMLVNQSKFDLNMNQEGWKTQNSIRTQAARLDYIDMRGPKISVGIDKEGNLYVLTINGRIRESVGATHVDMADIMIKNGMVKAMGFDPGGSSTLVVNGETLNISPYNSQYEKNVYSLPPEPRAVANAVIGFKVNQ